MTSARKRLFSLILILILMTAMLGSVFSTSYADEDLIWLMNGSRWPWPGRSVWHHIIFTESVRDVYLQLYDESSGTWTDYKKLGASSQFSTKLQPDGFVDSSGEGEAYFRYRYSYSDVVYYSDPFVVNWTSFLGKHRIAGNNRFDTALKIADEIKELSGTGTYPNAVIACGTDYADALGGTYLAACYDAPILLVANSNALMDRIAGSIRDSMEPGGTVYILGGEGAVPSYMEEALAAKGLTNVIRFAGRNRYDTNLKILEYCGVAGKTMLVCSGWGFADALSASALGRPILLTGKELTGEQQSFVRSNLPGYVSIVGGTGAVSTAVEEWFRAEHFGVKRYSGKDRYETSYLLADSSFAEQSFYAVLAYGLDFPDGLAGGPLAYKLGAPLLLVENRSNRYLRAEYFVSMYNDVRLGIVLGGPSLIHEDTVDRIMLGLDKSTTGHTGYGAPYAGEEHVLQQIKKLEELKEAYQD